MAYTQITAQVNDQTLQLINVPKLASGGVQEIRVSFDFCSLWDGAILKTAAFYRDKKKVYHVDLVDDACVAPHEVFAEEGVVYMGVFAEFDGGAIRTTEVLPLEVVQGAITTPSAPVLNIDGALSTDINNPTIMEPGPVAVSGTVYAADGSVKLLTVNGVPVNVNADGTWCTYLTVVAGQMLEIVAEATDECGNITTKKRYVCHATDTALTQENRALAGYTGAEGENLAIPVILYDKANDICYRVTSIGADAFSDCSNLTSVAIPSSVTSIGTYAFSGCSSLQSVTIPDSVTSIGTYAFSDCSSLQSVTIPNGVTKILDNTFKGCTNLTSVTIPASVTSIGLSVFNDCSSLQSVTIPNGVTKIDEYTFRGCSKLTSVTIPASVTSVKDYAFYNCNALANVYYRGTETQWNAITIVSYGNSKLTDATIHYNYAG